MNPGARQERLPQLLPLGSYIFGILASGDDMADDMFP
jgi:hypothetical protein